MRDRVGEARLENLRDWLSVQSDPVSRDASLSLDELLQRRAADRPDDAEPITAEWWLACFDSSWFGRVEADSPWFLERDDADSSIELCVECGDGELWLDLPHIRTRGDLRRLWVALTGKEVGK